MRTVHIVFRTFVLGAVMALPNPAAFAAGYKITPVTRLGYDNMTFWDINNAGLVTGYVTNADSTALTGFVYNSHTRVFTDVTGPAGAVSSYSTGVSDTGTVVGGYASALSDQQRGFIYEAGNYTEFNVPGATDTTLRGISADARYLTGVYDWTYGFIFDRATGNLITIGSSMILQGINSHGVVAGSIRGAERMPFLYDLASQVRTDYDPTTDRYRDVNDSGIVTGWGVRDRGGFGVGVGIVGSPGSMSELEVAGSFETTGLGINNAGTVVGGYETYDSVRDVFQTHAFIATSVPEPGAWALMLCGLFGLAAAAAGRRERD